MVKEAEIEILRRQIEGMKTKKTNYLASRDYEFPDGLDHGNQHDEISDRDTSIIGIKWVYKDIDAMRAPELLDKLLQTGTISPLDNYRRLTMNYKGKAILRKLAPNFDDNDDNHIDMLKRIAQHLNMDGCLLLNLNK